jgi:small subunit ribosomal protein S17
VHHVVKSIVAPFGEPIEARPPIPSEEERIAEREAKRAAKAERKRLRMMELRGERVAVEGGEEALGGLGGREKEEVQTL